MVPPSRSPAPARLASGRTLIRSGGRPRRPTQSGNGPGVVAKETSRRACGWREFGFACSQAFRRRSRSWHRTPPRRDAQHAIELQIAHSSARSSLCTRRTSPSESVVELFGIRDRAYNGSGMRAMEPDALDGCLICGIARGDADLDVYGRWCVDRDGCSRRWLERRKSSPHRLAFRPPPEPTFGSCLPTAGPEGFSRG